MKLYRNCDNDEEHISLHDCIAAKAKFKNNILLLGFEDGFMLCPGHSANSSEEPVRTGPSRVQFQTDFPDDITFYIFYQKRKKTIREKWNMDKFIKKLNSKSVSLEFLHQYKNGASRIIKCILREGKSEFEFEFHIISSKVFFMWNRLSGEEDSEDNVI